MRLRPESIRARLTLGLGGIALLVFSIAGVLLHRSLARDLAAADRDSLQAKVRVVTHLIEEARQSGEVSTLGHRLDDLLVGHPGMRIWLLSARGESVYGGVLPTRAIGSQFLPATEVKLADGSRLEIVAARLPDLPPWPQGTVHIGIDTRPRLRLLASHRNALIGTCALGVLLTVGLSGLASSRALAAVKRLSAQAAAITPDRLGDRLSGAPHDDELKGLVQAFNAALDRLEAAYGRMEAFNANVAHELRTSLATLMTGAQVLLSGPRSAAELTQGLASTLEDLEQMSALVNDMLFLARADQGDRAEGVEPVDLGVEVDRTLRFCDGLLQEAGVAAHRAGTADAWCNPALIRRALVNMLVNALRYTPRGEALVVEIEQASGRVRLMVFNPGEEIPAGVRARMFDRFYRAGTAAGQGLGLAIVAAIARMHGGRVIVAYTGRGNRIGLEFPERPT